MLKYILLLQWILFVLVFAKSTDTLSRKPDAVSVHTPTKTGQFPPRVTGSWAYLDPKIYILSGEAETNSTVMVMKNGINSCLRDSNTNVEGFIPAVVVRCDANDRFQKWTTNGSIYRREAPGYGSKSFFYDAKIKNSATGRYITANYNMSGETLSRFFEDYGYIIFGFLHLVEDGKVEAPLSQIIEVYALDEQHRGLAPKLPQYAPYNFTNQDMIRLPQDTAYYCPPNSKRSLIVPDPYPYPFKNPSPTTNQTMPGRWAAWGCQSITKEYIDDLTLPFLDNSPLSAFAKEICPVEQSRILKSNSEVIRDYMDAMEARTFWDICNLIPDTFYNVKDFMHCEHTPTREPPLPTASNLLPEVSCENLMAFTKDLVVSFD
ncbi:hypothetical protein H072_3444 [Dactylellina haptotyla CBS 200.50]|uniref:Uncharacterized protein n=1 Tax=Dactylellina haptotyla (strain CBS 200.50) TaxID=1284197 RepID=S8BSY8_DACHA|nr:hypothetical protein H072_3444 [Dactylellina haptotyla CBS 200.50]